MAPVLDELSRRRWAAAESLAIGYGGDALVSAATGLARETIRKGRREIAGGETPTGRIRRPGAGRPRIQEDQPGIQAALEALVDPLTRGDPTSPLRWTCKSRAKLAAALTEQGWRVSSTTVGRLLNRLGYRLQSVRKRQEGATHPDRNAQFEHINATADALLAAGEPVREPLVDERVDQQVVISVDTKKKELVGNFTNRGPGMAAEGHAAGRARARLPDRAEGKGDSLRRLRHGPQRSVGERRSRPRHAGLRGGLDSPLVAQDGPAGLPERHDAVHHGRCGREQRLSVPPGSTAATLCRSDPPDHPGQSFPTRDEQVEQDRAPALLPHHGELARHAADDI